MKIIEIDDRKSEKAGYWEKQAPLSYRISIKTNNDEIILTREYFYTGFSDGEDFDNFYFDNEVPWRNTLTISRATFITRKIDDEKYLIKKEKELIEKFYKKLIKSEKALKKELIDQTKELNRDIKKYQDYQKDEMFVKIIRNKKLKKISDI